MHLLGIVYEVVFIVKMKDNKDQCNIWNHSVTTLNIILPHSKTLTRPENLSDKPSEEWIVIQMDEFSAKCWRDDIQTGGLIFLLIGRVGSL